jgi:hypothetical protein
MREAIAVSSARSWTGPADETRQLQQLQDLALDGSEAPAHKRCLMIQAVHIGQRLQLEDGLDAQRHEQLDVHVLAEQLAEILGRIVGLQ